MQILRKKNWSMPIKTFGLAGTIKNDSEENFAKGVEEITGAHNGFEYVLKRSVFRLRSRIVSMRRRLAVVLC